MLHYNLGMFNSYILNFLLFTEALLFRDAFETLIVYIDSNSNAYLTKFPFLKNIDISLTVWNILELEI